MRLVPGPRALTALALTAACLGCGSNTPTTPGATVALITVSVAPIPIVSTVYSSVGPVYAAGWTTSIVESNGRGGTVQFVKATVYDPTTGKVTATANYDDKDLTVFVGTSRVEANGKLDVPQQATYVLSTGKTATLTVNVTFKDDSGIVQERSILANIE
jgi:hypothetical protein